MENLAELLAEMKEKEITLYAAHLEGGAYYDGFSFRTGCAFLVGNEGAGLYFSLHISNVFCVFAEPISSFGVTIPFFSIPPIMASAILLSAFGTVWEVPERMMDAVVGVSGSSPAYVFLFIEAMALSSKRLLYPRHRLSRRNADYHGLLPECLFDFRNHLGEKYGLNRQKQDIRRRSHRRIR